MPDIDPQKILQQIMDANETVVAAATGLKQSLINEGFQPESAEMITVATFCAHMSGGEKNA